jgi:hypothetical protein
MKNLGHYKTTASKTYHCHFDDNKRIALAMGPLPGLTISFRAEAENEQDAVKKLAQTIGNGVFTDIIPKRRNSG